MQIQPKGVGYDANFKPQSKDFAIGDPTMLIVLLRDKLYADKLRVFIQEYISNARDANREVGQPDSNIDITFPTHSDPLFKVRDFGPGLSPDRMENVFVNFGASTKRASDNFIGGFGIGAKSAWAYTDSFVVRSFHEGTEYHYLCHLGETPRGSMTSLYQGKTDEPNGVEIQVQIKADDIRRARELIVYLTHLWPQPPRFISADRQILTLPTATHEFLPFEIAGKNYSALPDLTALIDGIPYSIDSAYLHALTSNIRSSQALIFRVPTGAIDVAANREHIEINEKFKKWLLTQIELTITGFQKRHLTEVKKGLVSYIKFYIGLGQKMTLTVNRAAMSEKHLDPKALAALEKETVEKAYKVFCKPTLLEHMKDLDLVTFTDKDKPETAVFPRLDGFCWHFKKENVILVNRKFFPIDLKELKVYSRRRKTIMMTMGRTRKTKELFQLPWELWKGIQKDSDTRSRWNTNEDFIRGFNIEWFVRFLQSEAGSAPRTQIAFNDEAKPEDKLCRLSSRIESGIHFILDTTEIPEYLKELGVAPLKEKLYEPVRQPSMRQSRPTGSVRPVFWQNTSRGDFNFGDFSEPTYYLGIEDYFDKIPYVLYAYSTESRNKWGELLLPHTGRMTLNETKFLQGNKKGIEYLEESLPNVKFIHWSEWLSGEKLSEENVSLLEYDQFAYEWLKHMWGGLVYVWENDSHLDPEKIKNKAYAKFVKLVQDTVEKRGGRYNNNSIGKYFQNNKHSIKSIEKSKLYQMRKALLKRFELLPMVEIEMVYTSDHRNGKESNPLQIINDYTSSPRTYVSKKAVQLGSTKEWFRLGKKESDPDDC